MVTLGINTKELQKGSKEANKLTEEMSKKSKAATKEEEQAEKKRAHEEEKRRKEEEKHQKEIAEQIKKTREHIEKFLMIFTGGEELIEFLHNTITGAMEVGFLSQNVDMAVSSIAGFQVAMKDMGGSAEDANTAVQKASNAVAAFKAGVRDESLRGLLIASGGTGVDLTHATRSTIDFLRAQAAVIHALYEKNPQIAYLRAKTMMGISDQLFNMMKHGPEEMDKLIEEGAKVSALTKGRADAAFRIHKQWVETIGTLESIGRNVLLPILEAISQWFAKHEKDVRKFGEIAVEWVKKMTPKAIEKFGEAMTTVYKVLKMVFDIMVKMEPYLEKFANFMENTNKSGVGKGGAMGFVMNQMFPLAGIIQALMMGFLGNGGGTGAGAGGNSVTFNGGIHVNAGAGGMSDTGAQAAARQFGGTLRRSMGTVANSSVN